MIEPLRIITAKERFVMGLSTPTSLSHSRASTVWSSFIHQKSQIAHPTGPDMLSIQVYQEGMMMKDFNPDTEFITWAAMEVTSMEGRPAGLEAMTIAAGLYAVFNHKGAVTTFSHTAEQIFKHWIPSSAYEVDDRPHFEILGEKYLGPMNPESEEEVWIPIKVKK